MLCFALRFKGKATNVERNLLRNYADCKQQGVLSSLESLQVVFVASTFFYYSTCTCSIEKEILILTSVGMQLSINKRANREETETDQETLHLKHLLSVCCV